MSAPELPFIELDLGGNPYTATPENIELFTFSPYAKLWNGQPVSNPEAFNHVFAMHTQDGEVKTGAYIMAEETVRKLGEIMLGYGFPARLNQMEIPESDYNARQTFIEQNVAYEAENIPDEFNLDDWASDGNA